MTHYDPRRHHRRTIRLRTWDYGAAGAYFVTLVAQNRQLLFGTVADGRVAPSPLGEIVEREWLRSAAIRQEIVLDLFIVMPNHVHGIVWVEPGTLGLVGLPAGRPYVGRQLVDQHPSRWERSWVAIPQRAAVPRVG